MVNMDLDALEILAPDDDNIGPSSVLEPSPQLQLDALDEVCARPKPHRRSGEHLAIMRENEKG